MKKWLATFLFLLAAPVYATELNNFSEVKSAVENGKLIRFVVDFNQCTPSTTPKYKLNLGAFTPNEIVIEPDGRIAASLNHFTVTASDVKKSYPMYQFIRYTVDQQDSVNLTIHLLDASDYSLIGEKMSYLCKINVGAKLYKVD